MKYDSAAYQIGDIVIQKHSRMKNVKNLIPIRQLQKFTNHVDLQMLAARFDILEQFNGLPICVHIGLINGGLTQGLKSRAF